MSRPRVNCLKFGYLIQKKFSKTVCSMKDWSAQQYLKFEDERNRPCWDLINRIPLENPKIVVDIGCGPGNSTELLLKRYRRAEISGFDNSPDMIEKAKKRLPNIDFGLVDATKWIPEKPVDLIFANALFQWLPNHLNVLQNLVENALNPNGVLAVQMPDNFQEPTHVLMREVAENEAWRSKLQNQSRIALPSVQTYYNTFIEGNLCKNIDIWHTIYYHPLEGIAGVVEWLKGTGLRPFLNPLNEREQNEFIELYKEKLSRSYEVSADGKVLLKYPRLFIVVHKVDC